MFSVIITCYNREKLIRNAIQSVLKQTYSNFELIIVDDASIDKSVKIINTIFDPRIKVIVHHENRGQNAALNTGCRAAQFELLAFLDSDDEWLPNCLELYKKEFIEKPHIGFTYGWLMGGRKWNLEGDMKYAEALSQGYISSMITLAVKTEHLFAVGCFDERYTICQDDDICMRLAKRYSFSVIKLEIAKVGSIGDNMTRNLLNLANGWSFFLNNYKSDIIKYCGLGVWGRHSITLSGYYYNANDFKKALFYHTQGIFYTFLFKDIFQKEINYQYKRFQKCLKKYVKMKLSWE